MAPTLSKTAMEEKLIAFVQDRPFLYDLSHVDYRNVKIKENAWTKISELMKHADWTGEKCSKAWTSLKQQHNAYLRKLDFPTGSASESKHYFRHADLMTFLVENSKQKNIKGISNLPSTQSGDELEDEAEEKDLKDVPQVDKEPEVPTNRDEIVPEKPTIRPHARVHKKFAGKSKQPMGEFEKEKLF